jgi:membrane protease YdiL (CAAX protease family)
VNARALFFGREKLRAFWRIALFLVLAVAVARALAWPLSRLAPSPWDSVWGMTLSSGVLLVGLVVASAAMMRLVERRRFAAVGLPAGREATAGLLAGAAIGGGFVVAVVVAQVAMGWLKATPDAGTPGEWLGGVSALTLMLLVAAAAEELLFRGYAFQVAVEALGAAPAVALSAGLFGLGHVSNPEVGSVALLNIGLAGVLLAGAYLKTRSLWTAIGLHWAWNWAMAVVFDLPVSGMVFDVPGYDTVELGPDRLTGGAFGPEGGLMATLFLVPLIVWVYRTSRLKESARMAELRPLVDSRMSP